MGQAPFEQVMELQGDGIYLRFCIVLRGIGPRRSLNRIQALDAADLLDHSLSYLDIYHRLFPGEIPSVGD